MTATARQTRSRGRRRPARRGAAFAFYTRRRDRSRRHGFALLLALITVAILGVLVADMHQHTGTAFAASIAERDQLKAEYLAKSGVNLTRMLIAQEPTIRRQVEPFYRGLTGRRMPQINIWAFADMLLEPFSDKEGAREQVASAGYDLDLSEGLGDTGGSFELVAVAENSKVNVNDPLWRDGNKAKTSIAMQLYTLMGGYNSPSKYDQLFDRVDEQGNLTSRLDVVANLIDWWDKDQERTMFDPGAREAISSGGEDEGYYSSLPDPYAIKNAQYDTLEELRLVRGVNDDFWATFVEPVPDDPRARLITIYGSGAVNPNEAEPPVLLARTCSFLADNDVNDQLLCNDPSGQSQLQFITLLSTVRSMLPIPLFTGRKDFIEFMEGKGKLYGMIGQFAPSFTFPPLSISDQKVRRELARSFVFSARIVTIESTARVGRAKKRIRAVINTHNKWTPPPGNSGKMPPMGIFHYWRID